MRLLNKVICKLVHAGRCWNSKLCKDMAAFGFERIKAGPCLSRKFADNGELNRVVVVYVDDILAHAKDQATMERFAAELRRNFKLKNMIDTSFFKAANRLKSG